MIGVSVSPYTLADADTSAGDAILRREYGGVSAMLDALRDLGVGSVELRSVDAVTDPVAVVKSVDAVLGAGLALTVHSNLYGCEPKEFFAPLVPVFDMLPEDHAPLTATVHPLGDGSDPRDGDITARCLTALGEYILDRSLNAVIALENCRIHTPDSAGRGCDGVAAVLSRVPECLPVGATFDMGHNYSDFKKGFANLFPPEEFLRRAVLPISTGLSKRPIFPSCRIHSLLNSMPAL